MQNAVRRCINIELRVERASPPLRSGVRRAAIAVDSCIFCDYIVSVMTNILNIFMNLILYWLTSLLAGIARYSAVLIIYMCYVNNGTRITPPD